MSDLFDKELQQEIKSIVTPTENKRWAEQMNTLLKEKRRRARKHNKT